MDISDINRIANRKNVTTETEKLRQRISHETEKIMKLKVRKYTYTSKFMPHTFYTSTA